MVLTVAMWVISSSSSSARKTARLVRKRRRGIEAAAHFRRVDPEQPHPADAGDGDGVAVEDGGDEDRIGSGDVSWWRWMLRNSNSHDEHGWQNLHTPLLLARDCANREACLQNSHQ